MSRIVGGVGVHPPGRRIDPKIGVGAVDLDVYLLGRYASGAWIGLHFKVVET